ncbi:SDR family oxidoreductase [Bradyrhizobium sp. STM 3562]|uniref:SDR family oxidoreductase n=1 Tax=Bradyrhizobium sp. STM 3562 TaxID=578924 RepID=UPI00388D7F23
MSTNFKLFVTGATGHLGSLVIDALLERVPADDIVAGVRDPGKETAVAIRKKGVEVRVADYSQPETLTSALGGVDRLLLISGTELGQRRAQHRNVIQAAKGAGVNLIAYTSVLHADATPLSIVEEHRETEADLAASGVPYVLLRNGWYSEVFFWRLPLALKLGVYPGATGEGRVSPASRADYAEAAATVLTGEDHAGRVYELAGDASFTISELVAMVADHMGKPLPFQNMATEEFRAALLQAGVPEKHVMLLSEIDAGIAKGAMFDDGKELSRLIGRATTPFRETAAEVVSRLVV